MQETFIIRFGIIKKPTIRKFNKTSANWISTKLSSKPIVVHRKTTLLWQWMQSLFFSSHTYRMPEKCYCSFVILHIDHLFFVFDMIFHFANFLSTNVEQPAFERTHCQLALFLTPSVDSSSLFRNEYLKCMQQWPECWLNITHPIDIPFRGDLTNETDTLNQCNLFLYAVFSSTLKSSTYRPFFIRSAMRWKRFDRNTLHEVYVLPSMLVTDRKMCTSHWDKQRIEY